MLQSAHRATSSFAHCPHSFFFPRCTEAFEEAETEEWDDDSRLAPETAILSRVFKRMPYVIPFMTRVQVFRRLVAGHSLYSQVWLPSAQEGEVALQNC
jgi:hypothetical protein